MMVHFIKEILKIMFFREKENWSLEMEKQIKVNGKIMQWMDGKGEFFGIVKQNIMVVIKIMLEMGMIYIILV